MSFIHDAFHEILDDLNLGTIGSLFTTQFTRYWKLTQFSILSGKG